MNELKMKMKKLNLP